MKKVFTVILAILSLIITGCQFMPQASDFELTLTIESQEVTLGEDIIFNITFKNNCGRKLKIEHRGSKDVSNILMYTFSGNIMGYPANAVEDILKKNEIINIDIAQPTDELIEGTYFLTASAEFSYKGESFKLKTDRFEIQVKE